MSEFQACIELRDKKVYWSSVLCDMRSTAVLCHPGCTKDSLNGFPRASKCLGGTKVYKKNRVSGCRAICGAALLPGLADKMCLIRSDLTVLMLSVSIFPGWMARLDPPDSCL